MSAGSLRQIRYFVAVARTGSFTAAAEELNVSQPAVGLQVKFLEDRLGVSLFERHSRGVEITPVGQAYLQHVQIALHALSDAERAVVRVRGDRPIPVRLGSTPTIGRLILPHVINQTSQPSVGLSVSCEEGSSEKMIQMVRQGELDCAFCYDPISDDCFSTLPLYTEDLCLIGPASVIDQDTDTVDFVDMARQPLVLSPRPNHVREMIEDRARALGLRIEPAVELSLIGLKREFLLQFSYCAILPRALFHSDIVTGQISCRRIVNPTIPRTMCLLLNRKMSTVAVSSLCDMIRPLIAEYIATTTLHWRFPDATPMVAHS